MFLLLPPLLGLLRQEKQLNRIVKSVFWMGAGCAVVAVYESITGYAPVGIKVAEESGMFRVYTPGDFLMSFCCFLVFASYLITPKKNMYGKYFLFLPLYFAGILITLQRTLIIALVLVALFMTLLSIVARRRNIKAMLVIGLKWSVLLVAIPILTMFIKFDVIIFRLEQGFYDLTNLQGTLEERMIILTQTVHAIWKNHPIFGVGYLWDPTPPPSEAIFGSPYAITDDSGIRNILIAFGYLGLVLFVAILVTECLAAYRLVRDAPRDEYKILALASMGMIANVTIASPTFDSLIYGPHLAVVVLSWFILLAAQYFSSRDMSNTVAGIE